MTFVRRRVGTAFDINAVAEEWDYQILIQLYMKKSFKISFQYKRI